MQLPSAEYQKKISGGVWLHGASGAWLTFAGLRREFEGANQMKIVLAAVMSLLGPLVLGGPAWSGTIGITYDFAGSLTAPPSLSGGLLSLTATATGSVDQFNPLINAVWNPAILDTSDQLDLSTGLDNGTFILTFANGETLSGLLFENDTMVDLTTNTGPVTQSLTFTGGTGEFTGATGSASGNGMVMPTGYTVSGNGTLTAPGLIAISEPDSTALMLGGLMIGGLLYCRYGRRAAGPTART